MRCTHSESVVGLAAVVLLGACAGAKGQSGSGIFTANSPALSGSAGDSAAVAALIDLAKNGPDLAQFPEASAVVVHDQEDIRLEKDGRVVRRRHSIVKLLDAQRGKEKYADVHLPYDTKRQTLTIRTARTINPDGQVHVASKDEITDILPPELVGATMYSGVLERVVSFPAVDRGSVVELDFERVTAPTLDSPLGGDVTLETWDPQTFRQVNITAPMGTVPHLAVEGMTLVPSERDAGAGDQATRTWTFTLWNTPDRHPESDTPDEDAFTPRLVFSFVPDWKTVHERVAGRYLDAVTHAQVPAAIKAKADALVAGATSDLERAKRLYKFVAHDIRSVDLELGSAGYAPNPPEVVLAQRYGDGRDKVGLLIALCAARGIKATPVLVRDWGVPIVASVPTIAQFDRMAARISIAGQEDLWADPSDEYGQFGLDFGGQDNLVFALDRTAAAPVPRPLLRPDTSVAHVRHDYTVNRQGDLDARSSYALSGWFAKEASRTLRSIKGDNLRLYFQRVAARLSPTAREGGFKVGDLESVLGPISVDHKIAARRYAPAQSQFRVFELPSPSLEFIDLPSASLSKRKFPLWLGTPRTLVEDVTLALPPGWKVAYAPSDIEGAAPGARFRSSCQVAAQKLACHFETAVDRQTLPADQYQALRAKLIEREDYRRRVVLLKKSTPTPPPAPPPPPAKPDPRRTSSLGGPAGDALARR
jgi:hypothetical protein